MLRICILLATEVVSGVTLHVADALKLESLRWCWNSYKCATAIFCLIFTLLVSLVKILRTELSWEKELEVAKRVSKSRSKASLDATNSG